MTGNLTKDGKMDSPKAPPEIDRFDAAIIRELAGDGRMAVTELARRIGLSKTPTQARARRISNRYSSKISR